MLNDDKRNQMPNNQVSFQLYIEVVHTGVKDCEITLEFPDAGDPLSKRMIKTGDVGGWQIKPKDGEDIQIQADNKKAKGKKPKKSKKGKGEEEDFEHQGGLSRWNHWNCTSKRFSILSERN